MSGAQTSTFADPNVLLQTLSGAQTARVTQNQLLNQYDQATLPYRVQEEQQKVGGADMAAVGQASQALLNNYGDEASRAAAYPGIVAGLQQQGFAKNAPSVYPGEAALKTIIGRSLSVQEQYNLGLATNPEWTRQFQQLYGGGAQGAGGTAGAPGGGGLPPPGTPFVAKNLPQGVTPEEDQIVRTVWGEANGQPLAGQQAVASVIKNRSKMSGQSTQDVIFARNQFEPWNTDRRAQLEALDPNSPQYQQILNSVVRPVMSGQAQDPTGGATYFLNPDLVTSRGGTIPSWASGNRTRIGAHDFYYGPYGGGGQQTAAAAAPGAAPPATPGGAPARFPPGTVQAAGPAAGPPPAAPATPPAAAPAAPTTTTDPETGLPVLSAPPNALAPGGAKGPPAPPPAPQPPTQQPPAAAQPPAPQPAAAQPQQANLPHRWEVPTGVQTPQFQQAQALLARAAQAKALAAQMPPNSPMARQIAVAAARDEQLAASLQQQDNTVQTQEGQLNTRTGEMKDPTKPLPHYEYRPDAGGGVPGYVDTTGTNKPEFMPAQRDAAVAQHDVMELGPLVASGNATPEQKARYDVAVESYRQPELRENPVTKETVKVYRRDLPAGFPPSSSAVGGSGAGGSTVVMPGLSPAQQQVARDPAAYKVAESQYDRDSKEIAAIGDAGRSAQADQIRIREMQDVLQRFSSGPGTEARTAAAAWLQRWLPAGLTGWQKESANLSGSDAAQAFSKLALTGAGQQERGVLGNRGGYQAISLFQKANPNVDLQDATNKAILDMQLISNQANQDYSQSALGHFADNEKKFATTHQYDSLAQFDRNWNAQRNPQVYAAAMGAISGQPVEQWGKGLSREGGQNSEYARTLAIVGRAKPGTVVNADSGRIVVGPNAAALPPPPPGFKVVQ